MSPSTRILIPVVLLLLVAGSAAAQRDSVGSFQARLSAVAREVTVENGRLGGPGGAWLLAEAGAAQFTFIGEEHGIAEIPWFAAALWRGVGATGIRHVALEQGPWIIGLADRYVRGGDTAALREYRASVVPGLQYASDESLAFLDALRPAGRGAAVPVVWGLDQEMRSVPLLRALLRAAPTAGAREAVRAALARAEAAERPGRVSLTGMGDEIAALRRAFGARPPAAAAEILGLMEVSNRIYENNDAPAARLAGYDANREREEMMKDLFLRDYRAAQRAGERRPRVLLQLGAWHGMRGFSPTHVSTLGNFAAELARGEGGRMFNVLVTCGAGGRKSGVGEDAGKVLPCGADEAEFFRPVLAAARWRWTVFDLGALRPAAHAGVLHAPAELEPFVYAYDALLVIGGTTPMHESTR